MKAEAQLFTSPAGEGSFLPFTQSSNQNRVAEPKNAAIFEKGGEWGDPAWASWHTPLVAETWRSGLLSREQSLGPGASPCTYQTTRVILKGAR